MKNEKEIRLLEATIKMYKDILETSKDEFTKQWLKLQILYYENELSFWKNVDKEIYEGAKKANINFGTCLNQYNDKNEYKQIDLELSSSKQQDVFLKKGCCDIKNTVIEGEPFLKNLFLVELPQKYNVSETDICSYFVDRDKKELFITFREMVNKLQILSIFNELNSSWIKRLFSSDKIFVKHLDKQLKCIYKTVFEGVQLTSFVEDCFDYSSDEIHRFILTFRYKTEKIEI